MLMKSTPGVNFINILCSQIPKEQKDTNDSTLAVIFTNLRSFRVKATSKMLMKLTPDVRL